MKYSKQNISRLIWVTALSFTLQAFASTIYISQSGAGSQDGTSPSNARSVSWFNTAGNWGSSAGQIGPGVTVVLEGTITNELNFQGGGAAGNPITLLFDTNAIMTASYWPSTGGSGNGAITIYTFPYIVINGQNVGTITCTQCGTAWNNPASTGILIISARYVTVENLTISNMYVRTSNTDESGNVGGACIEITASLNSWSNILVMNCVLHDAYIGVASDYGNCSTLDIASNTIYRCNWGGNNGDRGAGATMTNLRVHDNWFYSWTNWNDTTGSGGGGIGNDNYHHNGFYQWANSGGFCTGVYFYRNRLGPGFGGSYQTSGLWDDGNTTNTVMFDNLVIAAPGEGVANEFLQGGEQVFNNTVIGGGGGQAIGSGWVGIPAVLMGNIVQNSTAFYNTASSIPSLILDTNLYYNLSDPNFKWNGSYTFAQWQTAGYDGHSQVANPLLNADGTISSTNNPAIAFGPNLTAWCQALGLPATDIAGKPRPATGLWTAGAYEFMSSAMQTNPAISITPVSISFGTLLAGTSATNGFVVQNTGTSTLTGSASVAAPFSIVSGGSYSLGAGQSQTVTVSYSPTTAGANNQTVTFNGAGGGSGAVSGTAVAPPVVSAITMSGADVDANATGLQIFAGSVVQFSSSASDPNGLPLTWQWSYTVNGGAQTVVQSGTGVVTSVSFNYTPSMAGNMYVWTLTANNGYSIAQSTLTVGVEAPPPATAGLTFQATNGVITAPFVLTNGYISQPVQTADPTTGGQAVFTFTTTNAGSYVIQALVNAPNDANNSLYVNVDAQPSDPTMIWDIPITSGFEQRIVSWRGNGADGNDQLVPAVFNFSAGVHQLIVRGREMNVQLQSLSILYYLPPPQLLHVVPPSP